MKYFEGGGGEKEHHRRTSQWNLYCKIYHVVKKNDNRIVVYAAEPFAFFVVDGKKKELSKGSRWMDGWIDSENDEERRRWSKRRLHTFDHDICLLLLWWIPIEVLYLSLALFTNYFVRNTWCSIVLIISLSLQESNSGFGNVALTRGPNAWP